MKISAFKEILLRKSAGNTALNGYINLYKNNDLIIKIVESLEKMARPNPRKGLDANAALVHHARHLTLDDIDMMKDALGHHISCLKAEHKAGNTHVADQHLEKIVPLMDLMATLSPHAPKDENFGRSLQIDYPKMEPYESNYTTPKDSRNLPKGLNRRPNKNANREINNRAVPDYRYLLMRPHAKHPETSSDFAEKGYPFENILVGSDTQIDATHAGDPQAHLDIQDIPAVGAFRSHPFDRHPVHKYLDYAKDFGKNDPNAMQNVINEHKAWRQNPSYLKWLDDERAAEQADPQAYGQKGKIKPSHPFESEHLLEQPDTSDWEAPAGLGRKGSKPSKQGISRVSQKSPNIDISALPPELRDMAQKQNKISSSSMSPKPATPEELPEDLQSLLSSVLGKK